jgi:hypothetical protein
MALCAASVLWLGLAAGCMSAARRDAAHWVMVETDNIQLRTNVRRDHAVQIARDMQRTYDVLARFALPCAARRDQDRVPVTVLPFREFSPLAPNALGFYRAAQVTWLPGYDGQLVLPDDLGLESRRVFQHEVTHRLITACFVRVPSWLNEGLAGFFETMRVDAAGVTFGRPPYVIAPEGTVRRPGSLFVDGQPVRVVSFDMLPPLAELFAMRNLLTHDGTEATPAYAVAWALVHFLVLGAPDLTPRYEAFLAALRTPGRDARALFAQAFEDVPLQDRLNAYLRGGKFDVLQSQPSAAAPRADHVGPRVRDLPEEEAHVHLAWLHAQARDDAGQLRFRDHVDAAKDHPHTRTAAFLVAAIAAMARGDLAEAEREVQEGLAGASDTPAFLEARVDILLARSAPAAELDVAAERLRRVATTAGQWCSLAQVALRRGDRKSALALSARGLALDPRLVICRMADAAE